MVEEAVQIADLIITTAIVTPLFTLLTLEMLVDLLKETFLDD
jgi:hypothetical protein